MRQYPVEHRGTLKAALSSRSVWIRDGPSDSITSFQGPMASVVRGGGIMAGVCGCQLETHPIPIGTPPPTTKDTWVLHRHRRMLVKPWPRLRICLEDLDRLLVLGELGLQCTAHMSCRGAVHKTLTTSQSCMQWSRHGPQEHACIGSEGRATGLPPPPPNPTAPHMLERRPPEGVLGCQVRAHLHQHRHHLRALERHGQVQRRGVGYVTGVQVRTRLPWGGACGGWAVRHSQTGANRTWAHRAAVACSLSIG
jgi:hypothetical protein